MLINNKFYKNKKIEKQKSPVEKNMKHLNLLIIDVYYLDYQIWKKASIFYD